jgi:DNA-binding transcriptional regulator YhcF (GntR family)
MNTAQPVFVQIMEQIETDIITGVYRANDLIISTTQISKLYSVNPTTAVKAVGKLADAGVLYKKRGIGMCVAEGAKGRIMQRRKAVFLNDTISRLLGEAKALNISVDEMIDILREKERSND